jgi:hypothetical protein
MIYIGFLLFVLIIFEVLNFFGFFSKEFIQISIVLFIVFNFCILVLKLKTKSFKPFEVIPSLARNNYTYIFVIVFALILKLIEGIFIAQNNWDSMSYHLPRYLHWIQNGSLDFFITPEQRQNISPVLPDYLLGTMYILFDNDFFIFAIAWISVIIASYYVYKIIYLLTSNRNTAILGFLASLFLPSQLAFMSSSQTDPISTALIIILLYYTILMKSRESKSLVVLMILMIPLFLTAKTTGLILSLPIYIFVTCKFYRYIIKYFFQFSTILIFVLLPGLPYLLRIKNSRVLTEAGVFASDISPQGVFANTLRILINNLQTPITGVNSYLEVAYYWSTQIVGINPNPTGYGNYGNFFLSNSLHADFVGNPIHLIYLFMAIVSLLKNKTYRILSLLMLSQLVLLGATIGWQPWINRFTSTILVVGSILIGIWIAERGKFLRISLITLMLTYSSFWIFYNPTRSLLDPKPLIFVAKELGMKETDLEKVRQDLVLSRSQQYFSVKPELETPYISAAEKINEIRPKEIFIKINGNDFEYPIWALTDFKIKINHFQEGDLSKIRQGDGILFCSLECDQYELKLLFKKDTISVWGSK